jgi:hypothetical protein
MQGTPQDQGETLREDGFVVIEDYLEAETCNTLYERISHEIEDGDFDLVEGEDHEYSYSDFVDWDGPVANKRIGRDDGMIDVFNVDSVVPEVSDFKNDEDVNEIIDQASDQEYTPENVNVYWNRSVTTTRDFHADSYSSKFKSFVYLTDVPDRSYGPFSYISGSHRISTPKRKASEFINRLRGNPVTDAVFYDTDSIEYCTAEKGTLIIANQAGYHMGHPQEEGRERMLMTTSYTPAKQS